MSHYLESAFHGICREAQLAEDWYVTLVELVPFYGGPEEGGWHGTDRQVIAFQKFASEESALAAAHRVQHLADELKADSQRLHGEHCLREMEWLEARGLDADFLPEPDGPSDFSVIVSQGVPESTRGNRHYE